MKTKKNIKVLELIKPYIGLILLVVFFAIFTQGQSISVKNIGIVTEQSMVLMLAATGVFFVMTTGLMDLSISGIVCVCVYVMAKTCTINIPLGLVITLLTGLGLGLFNGIVTAVLKVPSFLATLCTAYICTGIMTHFVASNAAIVPFELYAANTFEFKIVMVSILLIIAYILFQHCPFGHYVRMIGSNELGAHYSAVDVTKVRILSFVLNGGLAAFAAFLIGIRAGTAAISTGSDLMFNVMVALTLGGFPFEGGAKARISAAIVGSFTTYVLSNGMLLMGVDSTIMQLIKGSIFLIIILLTSSTFSKSVEQAKRKFVRKKGDS